MTKTKAAATGTGKYEKLRATCNTLAPIATAVAYPCEESALTAAHLHQPAFQLLTPPSRPRSTVSSPPKW